MERINPFLSLVLDEVDKWAMATCPEFKIGTFGTSLDNAREHLFENIKIASYIIVEKKRKGKKVDRRLIRYAKLINENGASIRDCFQEVVKR